MLKTELPLKVVGWTHPVWELEAASAAWEGLQIVQAMGSGVIVE